MTGRRDGKFGVEHNPGEGTRRGARPSGRSRPEARSGLGLLFARWDDPFTWSVRLLSWRGYRVGIHWFTVFWVIAQVLLAVPLNRIGPPHVAMAVGGVLLVSLLREAGRLAIARAVGGEPEYVVLWPLGSLIVPTPPRSLAPKLLVTLTPTLISLSLGAGLLAALMLLGADRRLIWFNPFDIRAVTQSLDRPILSPLVWAWFANMVVAGLNLLPMLPMDGGRLIEAWAWHTRRDRARRVVGLLTLMVAGLVAVIGIVAEQPHLIAIAVFGGWAGWVELRRSEFVEEPAYASPALPPDWIVGAASEASRETVLELPQDPDPPAAEAPVEPASARGRDLSDTAEIDAILGKISASGMGSLTDVEREALSRATRRLKGE